MTGTSTAGADWKGGGEIKALRRIIGGSSEEDEDAPAPVGHNREPQGAVHESAGPEIALEEQAQIVERYLNEAAGAKKRTHGELMKLRQRFCDVEFGRHARVMRMHAEGLSQAKIAAQIGISQPSVGYHIKAAAEGREVRIDPRASTRFVTWAAARFRVPRTTIHYYLSGAAVPARGQSKNAHKRKIYKLARSVLSDKVAPHLFKQAFLALGDRGTPARTAVACWIISLEAGSDDPQEVARWFAAHRLV
jgi:hypothetical protein